MKTAQLFIYLGLFILLTGCGLINPPEPVDPDTAEIASVDRFSISAGKLFVRDDANDLPGANEAIDFDKAPFITKGLGPGGELVEYYNFDVQPLPSAPLYVLFHEGLNTSIDGQLNIIDVIPGDPGYSDFWHMNIVYVPADYEANTVTSYEEIIDEGYTIERTDLIINCPVIPDGSTATLRYTAEESNGIHRGWYKSKIVYYFIFQEKVLKVNLPEIGSPFVPLSGIMVSFNINPEQEGGGPPSGFVTETGTDQTHNVLETLPEDDDYSPFWSVSVYNNIDFSSVSDWETAKNAELLGKAIAHVNCPVVRVN